MRRVTILVISLLVWAGLSAVPSGRPAGAVGTPATVDAHLQAVLGRTAPADPLDVVLTLDAVATPALERRIAALGSWSWSFRHLRAAAVRLPADRLDALRRLDGVRGVYLNRRLQYFLDESAALLNTRTAREFGVTGKSVTIAILDSGVDFTHPDLAPAMRANVKLVGFGAPLPVVPIEGVPNSDTSSGHGTHVAGDAASRGVASDGRFQGLAPGADLVGIGTGEVISIFTALEGFEWIMEHRDVHDIRVVNNSWGSGFEPFDPKNPVNVATRTLADAGVVVLFAMGNSGDEMTMNPFATAPWVIPVAAGSKTVSNGASTAGIADFTSGGIDADTLGTAFAGADIQGDPRRPGAMGLFHPAVTATGTDVVSTRANNAVLPPLAAREDVAQLPPDQLAFYTTLSGTSMATPETSGVTALILEAGPDLSPSQVRSVLQVTARPIAGVPFYKQGYGYTDASASVGLARELSALPASEADRVLTGRQAERDRAVLAGLSRPARTWAFIDPAPVGPAELTNTIEVPVGTSRLKVVASTPAATPFGEPIPWELSVTDAGGRLVGAPVTGGGSGTVVFDVDLRRELAFGAWTLRLSHPLATGAPPAGPPLDDVVGDSPVSTIAAIFP